MLTQASYLHLNKGYFALRQVFSVNFLNKLFYTLDTEIDSSRIYSNQPASGHSEA
jgi:hypothetical protein